MNMTDASQAGSDIAAGTRRILTKSRLPDLLIYLPICQCFC